MKENVAIEVKNIFKKFEEQQVLNGISFYCNKGTIVGIIGRNGSGKSVLLKCISGFLNLDKGEILIYGKKNIDFIQEKHSVGVVIESPAFLENYTGLKNLEFLYNILNKTNKEYLKSVMEKVGLDSKSMKKVKKYSMGMKQRLAIAQAIMEDQEILLFDEPMSGLDSEGEEEIKKLLIELKRKGKTIIVTMHSKEEVNYLCDDIYEIKSGKLEKLEN